MGKNGAPLGLEARSLSEFDYEDLERLFRRAEAFTEKEITVALEVFNAACVGDVDYRTLGLFARKELVGYVCYGPAPISEGTFIVYWMCVDPRYRRRGLGRYLLKRAEEEALNEKTRMVVIETSGKPSYRGTRLFWQACGYRLEAKIDDFYGPGDPILFYVKRFS